MLSNCQEALQWVKENLLNRLFEHFESDGSSLLSNDMYIRGQNKIKDFSVTQRYQPLVYEFYCQAIIDYCSGHVHSTIKKFQGTSLLNELMKVWENHKILIYWMSKIFWKLNKTYASQKFREPPTTPTPYIVSYGGIYRRLQLVECGLLIFKEHVYEPFTQLIIDAILFEIEKEREKQPIDRGQLKKAIRMVIHMGLEEGNIERTISRKVDSEAETETLQLQGKTNTRVYEEDFERVFLVTTRSYYEEVAKNWLATISCPEILRNIKSAFQLEEGRVQEYLEQSTESKIVELLVSELGTKYAAQLSDMEGTGCYEMFKQDKRDELRLMYFIFAKDERCLTHITEKMGIYIEKRGSSIVHDETLNENSMDLISTIIKFNREIAGLLTYAFQDHKDFAHCRDLAFTQFLNTSETVAPSLAAFSDNEMRLGLKANSESEVEQKLSDIITVFKHIYNRDVFMESYTTHFAKRLLDETSVNTDAERVMATKLTVECGHSTMYKLPRMNDDMAQSDQLMAGFRELSHGGTPGGITFIIKVLTRGSWPESNGKSAELPQELMHCFENYKAYYSSKTSGRRLEYLSDQGYIELGTHFAKKTYILVVNLYQLSILWIFNEKENVTLGQIKEKTLLNGELLETNLVQFFNPKHKILIKTSKGKKFTESELIKLNLEFTSSSRRVDFRPKNVRKVTLDSEEQEAIKNGRANHIDTIIVRIAKGWRTFKHNDLISEVLRQVQMFMPKPVHIKAQIETLIEREYLRRDENDRTTYHYIP